MNFAEIQHLLDEYGSNKIVEVLSPYVTENRRGRIECVIQGRLQNVQLAIEAPSDINNALAAIRTSEALGVSKVHLISPEGNAGAARAVTQGAIYWIEVIFHNSLTDFLQCMQQQQMQLAGGAVTATMSLDKIPVQKPLCLLMGNEQRGLSVAAKNACDIEYRIPMFGMTESFNLSVSAALSLYEVTKRKRELLKASSDLLPDESQALRARYYLNSLSDRLALAFLNQSK